MRDHYTLTRSASPAGVFHARGIPTPPACEVWWHDATAPALVLGSTQRDEIVDADACARAGVDVVRRRSGGGAVLLVPGEVQWIDVIVPRDTQGWAADIHTPMTWLGAHLADVLVDDLGIDRARVRVHAGPMVTTEWSSTVCFDGLGAGEVLLDGAKLIGISQRRTRDAARLQCCWYSHHDPVALPSLLAAEARPPVADLRPVATLAPGLAAAIPDHLIPRLPA
ncbi:MAG: hypothetical protein WBP59_16030 [Ilumatobacteraceae bacterium]